MYSQLETAFYLLMSKLILNLIQSQSWILRPMIHVTCIFWEYETEVIVD